MKKPKYPRRTIKLNSHTCYYHIIHILDNFNITIMDAFFINICHVKRLKTYHMHSHNQLNHMQILISRFFNFSNTTLKTNNMDINMGIKISNNRHYHIYIYIYKQRNAHVQASFMVLRYKLPSVAYYRFIQADHSNSLLLFTQVPPGFDRSDQSEPFG